MVKIAPVDVPADEVEAKTQLDCDHGSHIQGGDFLCPAHLACHLLPDPFASTAPVRREYRGTIAARPSCAHYEHRDACLERNRHDHP
jgi:hypothetical protein